MLARSSSLLLILYTLFSLALAGPQDYWRVNGYSGRGSGSSNNNNNNNKVGSNWWGGNPAASSTNRNDGFSGPKATPNNAPAKTVTVTATLVSTQSVYATTQSVTTTVTVNGPTITSVLSACTAVSTKSLAFTATVTEGAETVTVNAGGECTSKGKTNPTASIMRKPHKVAKRSADRDGRALYLAEFE